MSDIDQYVDGVTSIYSLETLSQIKYWPIFLAKMFCFVFVFVSFRLIWSNKIISIMILYTFFLTKNKQKHTATRGLQTRMCNACSGQGLRCFIHFSQHFQTKPLPRPSYMLKIPPKLWNKTAERQMYMHTLCPHALSKCTRRNQEKITRIQI